MPKGVKPVVISYPAQADITTEEYLSLISAQCPQEPYVMIAESFSGPLAIEFVSAKPLNLKALILCGSFVKNPLGLIGRVAFYLSQYFLCKFKLPISTLRNFLLEKETPLEEVQKISEVIHSVDPVCLKSRMKHVLYNDVSEKFRTLEIPLLYVRGSKDRMVRKANSLGMQKINPALEITEVASPHFILQTHSDIVVGKILQFLNSNTAEAP
jgi:pimeloyl-ACP methyl ester carboxylesterase